MFSSVDDYICVIIMTRHCTQAFQSVQDKSQAVLDLLSLAGCLTDMLIQKIASKSERLALTAQIPPTQLEWIRKQVPKCYNYTGIIIFENIRNLVVTAEFCIPNAIIILNSCRAPPESPRAVPSWPPPGPPCLSWSPSFSLTSLPPSLAPLVPPRRLPRAWQRLSH